MVLVLQSLLLCSLVVIVFKNISMNTRLKMLEQYQHTVQAVRSHCSDMVVLVCEHFIQLLEARGPTFVTHHENQVLMCNKILNIAIQDVSGTIRGKKKLSFNILIGMSPVILNILSPDFRKWG